MECYETIGKLQTLCLDAGMGSLKREREGALILWGAFKRIERHIVGRTLAGLLSLTPLIVTIAIIFVIIGRTDEAVRPFVAGQPWDVPGIGLLLLIAICYAIGLLVSTMPGRKLMEWTSATLNHIPIVSTIYGVLDKAMQALSSVDSAALQPRCLLGVASRRLRSDRLRDWVPIRPRQRGAHSHRLHPGGSQSDHR